MRIESKPLITLPFFAAVLLVLPAWLGRGQNRSVELLGVHLEKTSPDDDGIFITPSSQNPQAAFPFLDLAGGEHLLGIEGSDRNIYLPVSEEGTVQVQKGYQSGEIAVRFLISHRNRFVVEPVECGYIRQALNQLVLCSRRS